jgi:hypothetical protein
MLIALPVLAYFLLGRLFFLRGKKQFADALIKAHLVFFAIVAGSTELLSLFRAVEFLYVSVLWSLVVLVLLVWLIVDARNGLGTVFPIVNPKGIDGSPHERTLWLIIGLILTCTLATALLYPPNNYDSMTYHMARVAHWIHNQSVSFYLTSYPSQNYQMPLAEFAILHFQLLSGSDVFANCVQWIAFCVAISLAWVLTAELGGDRASQLASAIAAATLPMAILQSSSTQNDLTAASFIFAFALFMLRLRNKLNRENILFASLSLGLALLTKGTSYIYCAAVGISLAVPVLLRAKSDFAALKKVVNSLFLVVLLALILTAGHLYRNYALYGHPLSTEGPKYWNQRMSSRLFFSNAMRNAALHWGTPSDRLNWYVYRATQLLLGEHLDDRDITWQKSRFEIRYTFHEDTTGNPIHFFLAALSVSLAPALKRHRTLRVGCYALSVLVAAVLFCLLLKWQPYSSRFHTFLFLLSAPLIGIGIASMGNHARHFYSALITCMALYAMLFLLMNQTRKLLSHDWYTKARMELYFQNRPDFFEPYKEAVNLLTRARAQDVGLYFDKDWEYPLWVLADAHADTRANIHFRHVGVTNVSARLQTTTELPSYLLATKNMADWQYQDQYRLLSSTKIINIFGRAARQKSKPLTEANE